MFGLFDALEIVFDNLEPNDVWKSWALNAVIGFVLGLFGINYLNSVLEFCICILVGFAIMIELSIRNMKRNGKW